MMTLMRPYFAFALTLLCSAVSTFASPPISLHSGVPQMFVDEGLIVSSKDLRRTLHQPIKDSGGNVPVIALADEFGSTPATLEANGSIVYDSCLKKYVMFALGFSPTFKGPGHVRLFRFTSTDAISWIKGDDGNPEHILIDLTDSASRTSATSIDLFSCFYDVHDEAFPYKGWVWLANFGEREGLYYLRSHDGRAWERGKFIVKGSARRIEQDGRTLVGPSDVSIFSHDPATGRFLAVLKFNNARQIDGNYFRARAYLFTDRLDEPIDLSKLTHVALVPAGGKRNGDEPADEYYASTAWRYGDLWLGGLKVWHHAGDYPCSDAGSAFLKLAVSRDGLNWRKVSYGGDEVFIPNGPEGANDGHNDGGYITEFNQGPLRVGNELIYYYGCSSWGKNQPKGRRVTGGGIFRARLRVDGFVSVDAGTLVTRTMTADAEHLVLNSTGPLTIDLLNADGMRLETAHVDGDSLAYPVGMIHLKAGTPFSLRIQLGEGAHLYSFTVR